jgi:hypothetical protein
MKRVRTTSILGQHRNGLKACIVFTLLVSACSDAGDGPLAVAVAPETHGAIFFSEGFPTLPSLLSKHGLETEGVLEAEAWWASWDLEESDGAELRARTRPLVARYLLPALGPAGVLDLVGRNGLHLSEAEAVASFLASESIEAALRAARESHRLARVALGDGEWREALIFAIGTTDALWEVSPRQVAKDLIQEAETSLGRKRTLHTYSQEELTRIRRLMYGASEALDAGDYPRAIRRAYYACQLLGATPP